MTNNSIYILLLIGLLFLINGFIYPITLFYIIGLSCLIIAGYIYLLHPPSTPDIFKIYKSPMSPTANSSNYTTPSIIIVIKPQDYVSYYTVSTISPSTELVSVSSWSSIITLSPTIPKQDNSGILPTEYTYTLIVTATNSFGTSSATNPITITFSVPVQPIITYISPQLSSGFIILQSNYSVTDRLPIVINPLVNILGSVTIKLPALSPDESFYMIQLLNQTNPVSSITYAYPNVDVSGNTLPITVCIGPFGFDGYYLASIIEYTLFGPSLPSQFSINST